MKINNFFKLVIAIAVSETAGIIGSFFTISAIPTWYAGLVKPALNSPAWIFGPVWTTLYALMGIAALWLAIVWTMVVFYKISKLTAYLLVPYFLWVSFASYLNYSIWVLN